MNSILKIRNLSKTYPGSKTGSLRSVSLDVFQGEILSLIGPSGAGKSTLLRLIAGFEKPSSGEIYSYDQPLANNYCFVQPHQRNVGMVFQDFALFPHLTVAENIAFGLSKLKKKERLERVEECLSMVELNDFADKLPLCISGGQQQRVALARALAPNPKILLLDEPYSNMDAQLRQRLSELLINLLKRLGITAIFVTHDTADALVFADRVGALQDGHLLQIDTPAEICSHPSSRAVASMVGRMNLIPAQEHDQGLQTCFGHYCPSERQEVIIESQKGKPLWIGLKPECFVARTQGIFQGVVQKSYYTPFGREALIHYQPYEKQPPLPLVIPVKTNAQVDPQMNFNVNLEEATVLKS